MLSQRTVSTTVKRISLNYQNEEINNGNVKTGCMYVGDAYLRSYDNIVDALRFYLRKLTDDDLLLMQVSHYGSVDNVSVKFLNTFVADHYLVCDKDRN